MSPRLPVDSSIVLPDGSGFLGTAVGDGSAGGSNTIRIVYNWFDELEWLVPAK